MSAGAQLWLDSCGTALAALAMGYTILASIALRVRRAPEHPVSLPVPPTTILKPLCGSEPGLYEGLRSLCEQSTAGMQIICGVRDADDPALHAVRRLQREFPRLDLQIAANPTQHGASAKVSNLINMLPFARHDYLIIADSDVRVTPDYLERVTAPLLKEGVGIVTCLYRGCPRPGLWSLLGSLFINEWFMPSARVAALLGSRSFAFGATIALRRETLARIGGFTAIVDQLPDDYRLGELTRRAGLRTVLSEAEVETGVDEATLGDLVRHELRWLRTIRTVRPLGYALSGVTFGLPAGILGAVLAGGSRATLVMLAITALARVMIDSAPRKSYSFLAQLCLVTLNDLLAFSLWCWSFATRRVQWRHARYRVARDGTAHPIP
ncbi:MAG TPA: bacteriohopanetetrol glucosamine biosynthesis glycosyltransferase HpnI [Steroidobacteraceae bacterium]|jgi:ceramide glucosyltransferase|nr:bacteriohopanetetrol glucosamine biosynthesis glycosyltransferase HpnI [Steroidobacteraceae bacterium]